MYQIYFILEDTLHVLDGLSVHHQEFKTVHTAVSVQYMHDFVQQHLLIFQLRMWSVTQTL